MQLTSGTRDCACVCMSEADILSIACGTCKHLSFICLLIYVVWLLPVVIQENSAYINNLGKPSPHHHLFHYKSSAVAEMGDRGHNKHGPKRGRLLCSFCGGEGKAGSPVTQCGLGQGILPY